MTFFAAFILGVMASSHCAAMCGGLQQALQPVTIIRFKSALRWHNFLMNIGRLTTYVLGGAALAWGGIEFFSLLQLQDYVASARIVMASVLLLIGIQLLLRTTIGLPVLEKAGHWCWSVLNKGFNPHSTQRLRLFSNGLIWGTLPCGLLYTVYLTAALSGGALQGGLIMLGFGLGTMPSLLLSGAIWARLKRRVHHNQLAMFTGYFFILGGLLTLFAPHFISMEFAQNYPGLVSIVFCLR